MRRDVIRNELNDLEKVLSLIRKKEKDDENKLAATMVESLYVKGCKYVVGQLQLGDNIKAVQVAAAHLLTLIGSGGVFLYSVEKETGKGK